MKLNQLRYFQTTCRAGSIRRATELLHISQPSVSQAIAELEEEFQVQLFTRQGRSLILTDEGRSLLTFADEILRQTDEAEHTMQMLGKRKKVLRIGIPPMIGSLILPKLYRILLDTLHLSITESGREDLLTRLRSHELDAAFLPHDTAIAEPLTAMPVFREETVFCVHPAHPLAGRKSVRFEELADEKLILFRNDFFHTGMITERFRQAGITPHILFDTAQLSTIRAMISSASASGFLFRSLADTYPDIVPVSLDPILEIQISLVRLSGSVLYRELAEFIRITETLKQE